MTTPELFFSTAAPYLIEASVGVKVTSTVQVSPIA
jgi:hypothetical protein